MNELMSPEEKANELYLKFNRSILNAILCVNVILNETGCGNCKEIDSHYWNKVLRELELMKETN